MSEWGKWFSAATKPVSLIAPDRPDWFLTGPCDAAGAPVIDQPRYELTVLFLQLEQNAVDHVASGFVHSACSG